MGYTQQDVDLIKRHLSKVSSVIDFGAQNLYTDNKEKPPFVSEWYKGIGIEDYTCIDLAGDNNALKMDLSYPLELDKKFDLVVDCGTSEHTVQMDDFETVSFHEGYISSIYPKEVKSVDEGYYNCWLNKHNFLKIGGIMINVNPKQGNWPDHGYSYISEDFYKELVSISGYEILELGEWAACGNVESGWNIYCVLVKVFDAFPTFEQFKTLDIKTK